MLTFQQLRTPFTAQQGTEYVLSLLQSVGFQTTGWQEGRIQHTIVKLIGTLAADFSELGKIIAEYGSNKYATGDALTEYSDSRFDNQRIAAVFCEGPMRLTSVSSVPYGIEVGQLIATTSTGVEFRNTEEGVLDAGSVATPSTLILDFKAVLAGGTPPAEGAVNKLQTPLAGVTISNDVQSPWYDTAARDEESDDTLRARNTTKWATLSIERVADGYRNLALRNGASKAYVDDANPRGAGTVDVYVAANAAQLSEEELAALQAIFANWTFQTDDTWPRPDPETDDSRVSVVSAPLFELDVTLTVYHQPAISGATINTDVHQALSDLIARSPLGGYSYPPGLNNKITVDSILEAVRAVDGVVAARVIGTDIPVDPFSVVVEGTWTITTQAVTS